ncbi:MAG: hypothetical protein NVSMB64_05410 [Candidatus Velthaea sp.]
MKRQLFVRTLLGLTAAATLPSRAFAAGKISTTQRSLFDALPRPRAGQWVRLIMGSGVDYQKQIGAAVESTEHGDLLYYETQVGTPGGSCNPNTMKRTYLSGSRFASLFDRTNVLADVANSGTTLTRWSDIGGGQTQAAMDAKLQLLDASYLYDERPLRVVSTTAETLMLPSGGSYSGSADSSRGRLHPIATTHIVGEFAGSGDAKHRLTRIELWTSPAVPFGVAKYRAYAREMAPFELRLYSFGTRFKTDLAMSLETIRSITPSGTYIQTS